MSSASFPSLELECRPSRWLRGAVLVLVPAAALAVTLSALPAVVAAVVLPLGVLAWRPLSAMQGAVLCFGADGSFRVAASREALLRGDAATAALVDVAERGPLLVVALRREGERVRRLCFGPDSAAAAQRRLLRLWLQRHGAAPGPFAPAGVR